MFMAALGHIGSTMSENTAKFRSKSERANEVDLLAKYREIGIAAIAAANQTFRAKTQKTEPRRQQVVAYAD
jgi:hypothetical protein